MALTHDDDPRIPVCLSTREIADIERALKQCDTRGRANTVKLRRRTLRPVLDRLDAFTQIAAVLGECEHCGKETPIGLCPPTKDD